ncbi:MAG: hypothetical protein AcusKO_17360 [Acuticoccus sp.]
MKIPIAAALLLVMAGGALAQSYQTALPLLPAERRALNVRLGAILSSARADEISRFTLPGGRTVSVLPYRTVTRPGRPPCRGYRIDLEGGGGRTAVDGFRCQRRNGNRWAIVEPELILAQEGPQYPTERSERTRATSEPLYPSDDLFSSPAASRAAPPVPRPSPRGDDTTTAALPDDGGPADTALAPADEGTDAPFASRVAAVLSDEGAAAPPVTPAAPEAAAAPDTPQDAAPEAHAAEPAPPSAEAGTQAPPAPDTAPPQRQRVVAAAGSDPGPATPTTVPTRIVGDTGRDAEDDFSQNADIVASLKDLAYLADDVPATAESVEAAVGEFAVDERFALPVSADVLIARLDAAIERSETLPGCEISALRDLCTITTD